MGHDEAMEDQVANAGIREELILRLAERQDVETLHRFIVELAEAESFPGEVSATPRDRAKALFGERQLAEAVVAVLNGDAVGFALYYPTYSTVLGREGIHLEDLYVSDQYRGLGIGQILLQHLAELANRRGAECADRASSGRVPGSWRRRLRTGRQRLRGVATYESHSCATRSEGGQALAHAP
jgi:GNAT superfamily N-acetyltransferase